MNDFSDGYDPLYAVVWQDVHRHLMYGRPDETLAKVWTDLRERVDALADKAPRDNKVKLAGTLCRGDKLYEIQIVPDTVVHERWGACARLPH